jgi:hypothetical protein
MRRIVAFALAAALTAMQVRTLAAAPVERQAGRTSGTFSGSSGSVSSNSGEIGGIVSGSNQQPLASRVVRLRNIDSGAEVARSKTDAAGRFRFKNLSPGTYIVEVLDESQSLVGVSEPLSVTDNRMVVDGVAVLARTSANASAATGTGGSFFSKHAIPLLLLAAAGGVATAAVLASRTPTSPVQ